MDLRRIKYIYELYENKAYVDAEIGIRNLLKEAPNNTDVLRLGALTALSLNQVVTAHARLMEAMKICPITAEMANTLGNILKAAGEWSQAEEAYRQAIDLDQTYEPVRANLIDLLIASGQAKRAYMEINQQLNAYGASDFLNLASANALILLGRYNEALACANKLSKVFSAEKLAKLKVQLYFHLERYEDMRKSLDMLPADSPYAEESVALAVNAYAMQDDWKTAQDIINSVCMKPNVLPSVLVKSTHLLSRGGHIAEAEKIQHLGQSRFSEHVDILAAKAKQLMERGQPQESCEGYKEALALRPGDYKIMIQYAQACLLADRLDECASLIQGALQQAPNSQLLFALAATLQRKRGVSYQTLYNYDQFIQIYDLTPPKGYKNISSFNDALKDCLEQYHGFKSEPLNQSLRIGIQTDTDLAIIDDPVLKSFFEVIDAPIVNYIKKIGYEPNHPLKRRNTHQYRINGAWSVKLSEKGHHVNHVHPMGWISSSYYVDVPDVVQDSQDKEGWIKFGEPDIPGLNLRAERYVEPKGGRLVLFPSYMWHGTVPFTGSQTRLTLPFDVLPA
ncbi:putative 2OG-Fe(II) oxygenase [Hellea balneolensis]|uniref:putative 2OG-Fe(II) oxygenase n=1 Tax=Hellea balneolensis TaxID=287478 RepID=UPI000411F59E|nr:putative 2OG-Fe(II) oxygenase [Hellea balneolensis]